MYLTIDQLQLIRLLCDLSLCKLQTPEKEQVEAMLFSVEEFLFSGSNNNENERATIFDVDCICGCIESARELVKRFKALEASNAQLRVDAADALEAAQAESACHKHDAMRNAKIACNIKDERDAALARLAELEKQKPCAALSQCTLIGAADCSCGVDGPCEALTNVYLAAGASPVQPSQPLFKEIIDKHQGLAEELRELDIQPTKGDQHEQQLRPEVHPVGGQQPVESTGVGPGTGFRGSRADLVASITALLSLDAAGALVPHGIGGHARTLLTAAAKVIDTQPSQAVEPDMFWNYYDSEKLYGSVDEFLNAEICNGNPLEVGDTRTIQCATRLPNFDIRITAVNDEECAADYEVIAAINAKGASYA